MGQAAQSLSRHPDQLATIVAPAQEVFATVSAIVLRARRGCRGHTLENSADSMCRICGARIHDVLNSTLCPSCRRPAQPSTFAHLFYPSGRVDRETYLTQSVLCLLVAAIVGSIASFAEQLGPLAAPFTPAGGAILAAAIWSQIAVALKRLHDLGRPNWHLSLFLIPFYNVYLGFVLVFKSGTIGANAYGADPLQAGLSEAESLLNCAFRHEMRGDWDRALELYNSAAQKSHGEAEAAYPTNCVKRVQVKVDAGKNEAPSQDSWVRYVKGAAAVLAVYAAAMLVCGVVYPSARIANPGKLGPNVRVGSVIYQGKLAVFGWPFSCVAWREETDQPNRAGREPRMRIVAFSVSWLAVILNASAALSVYSLVALVRRIGRRPRMTWRGLAFALVCGAVLASVASVRNQKFLKPIPIYEDEKNIPPE